MYTAEALEGLGLRLAVRDYERGAAIFEPSQYPERVYFLLKGMVRIYKEYGLAKGCAKEFTSEILADNEVFGLEAMAYYGARGVRRQGAQAFAYSQIASVSARELAAAMRREPGLAGDLLEEAMYGVQRRDAAAELLAHREVRPRLASALLSLGESLGVKSGSRILVKPGFSHEELAQMTGCTREAVSKAISELRFAGAAEAGRAGITIKDPEALTRLAALGAESNVEKLATLA